MKALAGLLVIASITVFFACSTKDDLKNAETATTSAEAPSTSTPSTQSSNVTLSPVPTTPSSALNPKVTLTENGYTVFTNTLGTQTLAWAAVLQNTSMTQQATGTTVTALFYDASGVVLKTDDQTAAVVFPNSTSAVSGSAQINSTPVRMDIRVSGTKFQTPKSTASLGVSGATLTGDRYTTKALANVTNPFSGDLTNLEIVCIVADAAGHYLGVGNQFLALLPASSTGQAECGIDSREDVTGAASTRVFVGVSNITTFGTPPP